MGLKLNFRFANEISAVTESAFPRVVALSLHDMLDLTVVKSDELEPRGGDVGVMCRERRCKLC